MFYIILLIYTQTIVCNNILFANIYVVFSVVFSNDGKYIITGSIDKTVNLIDIKTRQVAHKFTDLHPNGKNILYLILILLFIDKSKYGKKGFICIYIH